MIRHGLMIVVVGAVLCVAAPAHAGGQPDTGTNWAGVQVTDLVRDDGWRLPVTMVSAEWTLPCMSPSRDGVYGSVDMWIGLQSGNHLIQVGTRSTHVNVFGYVLNLYAAWVVNTANPATQTPLQLFGIGACWPGDPPTRVRAAIDRDGRLFIQAAPEHNGGTPSYRDQFGPPMASPQAGDFIVERAVPTGSVPWFGAAQFNWCKVITASGSGGYINNSNVTQRPLTMYSRSAWRFPPLRAAYPADYTMYGDFVVRQLMTN